MPAPMLELSRIMLTGVRLAPLVSVRPVWSLFGFPSRTRGSFLKSFLPRPTPENVKGQVPAQPPDPGLAEKL